MRILYLTFYAQFDEIIIHKDISVGVIHKYSDLTHDEVTQIMSTAYEQADNFNLLVLTITLQTNHYTYLTPIFSLVANYHVAVHDKARGVKEVYKPITVWYLSHWC